MKNKMIFSTILMLFIILSAMGLAAAGDPLSLTVTFDKKTVNVGDNVTVTIIQKNNGIYDSFKKLKLLITIKGNGIELDKSAYLLNPSGSGGNNNFTAATGIWESQNLKKGSSGGGMKTLVIYVTIPSELEGKTISANAHYISVQPDPEIPGITFAVPNDASDTLTVQKKDNETGNSNGSGNTAGNSITSSNSGSNINKKNAIEEGIKNKTNINALQNLTPSIEQGKSYEVNNVTNTAQSDTSPWVYMLVGIVIVILIGIGYFKGLI